MADTDVTNGVVCDDTIDHYITFPYGDFDSRDFGLKLHKREAPTPSEKTDANKNIPYRQGVLNLSNVMGIRFYTNREIKYTFYVFGIDQSRVNGIQTSIENMLMGRIEATLQDSFDPYYHYIGTFSGIETEDEYEYGRVKFEMTFEAYPFKIANLPEGSDYWDSFNFNTDIFQDVVFEVAQGETLEIDLYSAGQNIAIPTIIATTASNPGDVGDIEWQETAKLRLQIDGNSWLYDLPASGAVPQIKIKPGWNKYFLTGIGTVQFTWYRELI